MANSCRSGDTVSASHVTPALSVNGAPATCTQLSGTSTERFPVSFSTVTKVPTGSTGSASPSTSASSSPLNWPS